MKNIDKVTLTIGQLKRLVKECNKKDSCNKDDSCDESVVTEGWLGGIAGFLGAIGIAHLLGGLTILPWLIVVFLCTWAGSGIQRYFGNKGVLKNLNNMQVSFISSLAIAGKQGIKRSDFEKLCKAAKKWYQDSDINVAFSLVERGYATYSQNTFFITDKGIQLLKDAGFKQEKFAKDFNILKDKVETKLEKK